MKPTATAPANPDRPMSETMVREVTKIMGYKLVPGASWDEHRSVLVQIIRDAAEEALPLMPPFEREAAVQDLIEDVTGSDAMVFGLADARRGAIQPYRLIMGLYQATKYMASQRRPTEMPDRPGASGSIPL